MGTKHKRKFSAEFKAKVCLESIKERSTTEMISKKAGFKFQVRHFDKDNNISFDMAFLFKNL